MDGTYRQNADGTWSPAEPVPADPRIWTHYYEARDKHGRVVAEGMPPGWVRLLLRVVRGWRWHKV